ncbi:dynein light chain family protein [Rhodanobacter hydrolyticus]|uniref:Uncharacterized protein n=1 Tax=Rhodanobacter hydrolyticus TaxID=2250595 RepID=A0ABW8J3Y2_9GAMM
MKPETLALLQRLLAKLNEKSSVYGYVALVTSVLCKQWANEAGSIAAIISASAGIALVILSDPQVRFLLTGQKPPAQTAPTVPQPFDSDTNPKG